MIVSIPVTASRVKDQPQPNRRMSSAAWDDFIVDVFTDKEKSVAEMCASRGVSRSRFYQVYAKRKTALIEAGRLKGEDDLEEAHE